MILLNQNSSTLSSMRSFDVNDRGLQLADGLFDTFLVRNGRCVFQQEHKERLIADCRALEIDVEPADLDDSYRQLSHAIGEGGGRLTITRGVAKRGISASSDGKATLIGQTFEFENSFPGDALSATIADIRRNETSPTARHKTLAYVDNTTGVRRAKAKGFDDAMFLNTVGHVTCFSVGNLFAEFEDGSIVTPPLNDGVLPGVTRRVLMEELDIQERSMTLEELTTARSVFMTNSLRMAQAVSRIDDTMYDAEVPDRVLDCLKARLQVEDE